MGQITSQWSISQVGIATCLVAFLLAGVYDQPLEVQVRVLFGALVAATVPMLVRQFLVLVPMFNRLITRFEAPGRPLPEKRQPSAPAYWPLALLLTSSFVTALVAYSFAQENWRHTNGLTAWEIPISFLAATSYVILRSVRKRQQATNELVK